MAGDNWGNRSCGQRCGTCIFFVEKFGAVKNAACCGSDKPSGPDPRGQIGRCRRHAPTMQGFPVVFANDFCGDHKLDENKL